MLRSALHLMPVMGDRPRYRIAQQHNQPCLRHQGMHPRHHHGRPIEIGGSGLQGTTATQPLFPKREIGAIPTLTAVVVVVEVVHLLDG
jgi:hypothetical protein